MAPAHRLLQALFDSSADALVVVGSDGRIRLANEACRRLLGYPPQELVGLPVDQLVPAPSAGHRELREAFLAQPQPRPMGTGRDLAARHRDGHAIPVDVSLSPFELDGERLIAAALRDDSARNASLITLRVQATALASAANGVVITDRAGAVLWANPAASRLTGYPLEELIGGHTRRLKSGVHDEGFYRDLWATVMRGEVWSGEIVNRRKDGSLYHEEQTIAPVVDAHGEITHLIAIKQDVTDRRHTEEALARAHAELAERLVEIEALNRQLREQALRDPLTGVHNRRLFDETIERELMRATREKVPLSLVALDLDQLKELNDGHGHGAGDEALRSLAGLLGGSMRRSDFLCRMGGDEFVLVLPGARLADAVRQCERWRVAFDRTPVALDDGGVTHATFSAGVAEHLPHEAVISLLQRADAALYEAKRTGRNRVLAAPRPDAEER